VIRLNNRSFFPEKKCQAYIKEHLRAPPSVLIKKWGKQLKIPAADVTQLDQQLLIRYKLGKEGREGK